MKIMIIGAFFALGLTCYGQRVEKCCETEPIVFEQPQLPEIENYDGTFQFQIPQNDGFSFTNALLDKIYAERKATEDVLLDLGNGRSVLILSEETIQSPSFVAFTTPYTYK